ncbi:MAG: apocytochrome f, partial [Cyanobacteria bacterium P01_H01_bin.121]
IKASVAGVVDSVKTLDFGSEVVITTDAGEAVVETIPPGTAIIVEAGTAVAAGESLTTDPNVGGFGQMDTEIVLQSGGRIAGLLAFFTAVMLAQILLVLKKKQVEKVQAAELNF